MFFQYYFPLQKNLLFLVENKGALVAMYSQQASNIVIDAILNDKVEELSGYDIVESDGLSPEEETKIDKYMNDQANKKIKGVLPLTKHLFSC